MPFVRRLMRSIENFYHPSNEGHWSRPLGQLLKSLCEYFARRLGKERQRGGGACALQPQDVDAFVQTMIPAAMQVFSGARV